MSATSALKRSTALGPQQGEPLRIRLPPMPASTTLSVGPESAVRRRARSSGQLASALADEPTPAVIESPSATTAPTYRGGL